MKTLNYTTVEELLASDGFLKWYQSTDKKEVQLWNDWIAKNPEHQRLANEAVQLLLLIRTTQENKPGEQEIKEAIIRLTNTIRNEKHPPGKIENR